MPFENAARKLPPQSHERAARKKEEEVIELSPEDLEEVVDEEAMELSPDELIEVREPGELQEPDVVEAFEVEGFKGLDVAVTLEAKNERKKNPENRNQDNIIADPETGLLGVLDGLGGETHGDLASKTAEEKMPGHFAETMKKLAKEDPSAIGDRLVEQQLAHLGITDIGLQTAARKQLTDMVENAMTKDPEMGRKALALIEAMKATSADVAETKGKTTATVGFVHETPDGSRWAVVANIGDSGAFKRRENGEMVPLTKEDSLYNAMVNSGAVTPEILDEMKYNPDKAVSVPVSLDQFKTLGGDEPTYKKLKGTMPISYKKMKAVMITALGQKNVEPSLAIRKLEPGDELVLATDGVIDKFENQLSEETELDELASALSMGTNMTDRLNAFRRISKERTTYKKDDDIAIVSARVPKRAMKNQNKKAA